MLKTPFPFCPPFAFAPSAQEACVRKLWLDEEDRHTTGVNRRHAPADTHTRTATTDTETRTEQRHARKREEEEIFVRLTSLRSFMCQPQVLFFESTFATLTRAMRFNFPCVNISLF